ncbi:GNAT family N-acetyltransferase [Bacillus gaemokensis]|uniref:Acetyltransferase n=1 Tax=Bacillus gaemokensis TaxID=574375 RepID=A0A073KB51_9BACI|nr:GNAT family N-acetyltransferase [Bacillus gaemokensis]KEK24484.1 acetyltransferase [Bacillus gaemokensis]KYG39374.1 acetyltransferase [Bacillus gaemokensis]
MMKLLHFPQEDCPLYLKEQIISLMQQEWPEVFVSEKDVHWPDSPETYPISLVLVENHIVISHVSIPHTYIKHRDQTYKAYGLSEVMTNPTYRHQGYGLKLIKEAALFIEKQKPDISIFTCKPNLVSFYRQGGWIEQPYTYLVGGTRLKPFRSDALGLSTMMRLFSDKALKHQHTFEETDIHLELGENKLW